MKILFVVPYVPSLVRVRPFNLVRGLIRRGHQVTVATAWANDGERDDVDRLGREGASVATVRVPRWRSAVNCLHALLTGEPLQARYSWSKTLAATVADLARDADVVHVEHLRGARYGLPSVIGIGPSAPPVVWDSVDCITDLFAQAVLSRADAAGRLINLIELARTRRFEGWAVSQFDRVVVSSDADAASLAALAQDGRAGTPTGPARAITVLPNGVDLEYFAPGARQRDADTAVFSGKMSYHANDAAALHLLRDVMPLVWQRRPSARLVIVGRDPSRELRRAAATCPEHVTVTGTVPDVRPFLQGATVAIAPLVYGVGCQNKVLEAMACATPVVATPRSVGALRAQPGRDLVVATGPDEIAGAVVTLFSDAPRRRAIGEAGRAYVQVHHRWDIVAGRLENVYREAIAARHSMRVPARDTAMPAFAATGTEARARW